MQALTIQEAADRLRVHGATVRRLIKRGAIKAVRLGGGKSVRILETEVDRLLTGDQN